MFGDHDDMQSNTDSVSDDNPVITPAVSPATWQNTQTSNVTNELIDIKRQALNQLTPLIKHLDQSPDAKFETLMMMIQASDDQMLVKLAYETALLISDDKIRAQALLDIVNEINYFTRPAPEK